MKKSFPPAKKLFEPLFKDYRPNNKNETRALNLLRKWNGVMSRDSHAASLAGLIHEPWHRHLVRRSKKHISKHQIGRAGDLYILITGFSKEPVES
jgi:acyl-homoserine lactone acylase PvdQ